MSRRGFGVRGAQALDGGETRLQAERQGKALAQRRNGLEAGADDQLQALLRAKACGRGKGNAHQRDR